MSTPSGFPPLEIRKAWVGIKLEVKSDEKCAVLGLGIDPKHPGRGERAFVREVDGYTVTYQEAMVKLLDHNKEAYKWWIDNFVSSYRNELVFNKKFCKVVG